MARIRPLGVCSMAFHKGSGSVLRMTPVLSCASGPDHDPEDACSIASRSSRVPRRVPYESSRSRSANSTSPLRAASVTRASTSDLLVARWPASMMARAEEAVGNPATRWGFGIRIVRSTTANPVESRRRPAGISTWTSGDPFACCSMAFSPISRRAPRPVRTDPSPQ
jgi:hypothetical protein